MTSGVAPGSAGPVAADTPGSGRVTAPVPLSLVGPDGRPAPASLAGSPTAPDRDPVDPKQGFELTTDAWVGFSPGVSVVDLLVTPDQLALTLQSDGVVRVLDVGGAAIVEVAAFPLKSGLTLTAGPPRLTLGERGTVLVPVGEGLAMFSPAARSEAEVTWLDLSGLTVTWPAGTRDSAGYDVGGRALPLRGATAALELGGRLLVTSSNRDGARHLPGTLAAIPLEGGVGAARVVATSGFAPTGMARLRTAAGDRVVVTNSGSFGGGGASIDLFDAATLERLATIPIDGDPAGPVVFSADGQRGYVGSQSRAAVDVLDLAGKGAWLGQLQLPSTSARNELSQLLLDPLGRLLAVNHYESTLYLLSFGADGATSQRLTGFSRSGDPGRLEGLLERVALRRSPDGGVELLALTVELAAADQVVPGVSAAIDLVRLPEPAAPEVGGVVAADAVDAAGYEANRSAAGEASRSLR